MPLSDATLQTILHDYETRRAAAENARDRRIAEIYRQVPEIRAIDDEIESFGLNAMKGYLQNGRDAARAITSLRERMEALNRRKTELLQQNGYSRQSLEAQYTCPLCRDTGYVQYEKCSCLKQRMIEAAYGQSGLQRILQKQNRSTFDPSLFSDEPFEKRLLTPRQNILHNLDIVTEAIRSFDEKAPNLLFTGTPGTGKTFMSSLMAKDLMDLGYTVLYVSIYDLCRMFERERFGDRARTTDARFPLEQVETCDLLIIDDLGTEFSNALSTAEIFHCINNRLLERRSTLISTNLTLRDLAAKYDDRLISRILGAYTVLAFYGPDLRLTRHETL